MNDKIRMKKENKRIDKDIQYFIDSWDMSKTEAINYMLEVAKIRVSLLEQRCRDLNIKSSKDIANFDYRIALDERLKGGE